MQADAASTVLVGALEGPQLSEAEARFIRDFSPSGLTLFARNIEQEHPEQLKTLCQKIQTLLPNGSPPMVIAIDQEGGRVRRIKKNFPNEGPALHLAGGEISRDALLFIEDYGKRVGESLSDRGVNVNFAPVVDVFSEPTNESIGDRCFGKDPQTVALRAEAFLRGMQSSGVLGCLKHFPGQGDAKVDTHIGTATIAVDWQTLKDRELIPFNALLNLAPMVMISHSIFPALENKEASLSSKVMRDLLRGELRFKGVVVSDDMMMGAIAEDEASWKEAIVEAIANGADMILVCRDLDRWRLAYESLRDSAAGSPALTKRLEEAAQSMIKLRRNLTV